MLINFYKEISWCVYVTSFEEARKVQEFTSNLYSDMELFNAANYYGKQGFVMYSNGEYGSLDFAKEKKYEITPFEEFVSLF